jgi:uncharacterized protein YehS (DUF1456 family)
MFKRFLSAFLVLSVIVCGFAFANASSDNDLQSKFIVNQNIAYEKFNIIKEHYKNKYGKENAANYAGAYLDEEGNLNINLVDDTNVSGDSDSDLKSLVKDDSVKYHKVKYSYDHLNGIISKLNNKMIDLDINAIELDEQNNKIYIYLKDLSEIKTSNIKKLINSSAVEFKQQNPNLTSTFTATETLNGFKCTDGSDAFTLGFGAKKSDGTIGYVFPGHISGSVNSNVWYGGTVGSNYSLGTISQKVNSGNTDASFIKKVNTNYTPSIKLYDCNNVIGNYSYSGYVAVMYGYIQNTTVTAFGAISGRQVGTITSSSFGEVVGGISRTDCVKCTYKAIHGDSGAPVCVGSSYMLAGTQSWSALDQSGNWVTGSYSCLSKINNILNTLGCTPTP